MHMYSVIFQEARMPPDIPLPPNIPLPHAGMAQKSSLFSPHYTLCKGGF